LAIEENARKLWKRIHDKLPPRIKPYLSAPYRIIGRTFPFDTSHT
jgi:hypothetical protein